MCPETETVILKEIMELFFHDVGVEGATRDFPKTVFGEVALQTVERHLPDHLKSEVVTTLGEVFPRGDFNCWGVPSGAASVIKQLRVGDAMLLIRTTGGDGDIPALCVVKAYWREELLDLSRALWGSTHFPYIFFFDTEAVSLTWVDFKRHVGYAPNFRPSGNVYRVRADRLEAFGGVSGYLDHLRDSDRPRGASGARSSGPGSEGRVFGHVPGFGEGSLFESRAELSKSGVHQPTQACISGSGADGADSIVLSGGYEDAQDLGDVIIYTGHGGSDPGSGRQVRDQELTLQNLALAKNKTLGLPVRVIRGGKHRSDFSPESGYRYDGLFSVDDYWHETGRSGFRVWRYRLMKVKDEQQPQPPEQPPPALEGGGNKQPARRETTTLRIVRDTKRAKEIKKLYDFTCQMCGVRLEGSAGPYAEAAHIRPLGTPHNGPDTTDNLLCLCPNHHVLFDLGGIAIADDLSLIGAPGRLSIHPRHVISTEHVKYHRDHYRLQ